MTAASAFDTRTVWQGDGQWPNRLDDLTSPDITEQLWVLGNVDLLSAPSVSIIGSRFATMYGEHVAIELATDLVEAGYAIVSGGAFGIDAAAHRGALRAGNGARPGTIVVLPCGVDRPYPVANRLLFGDILHTGGAIISAYPPGTPPARYRFLQRNSIIAALSMATVVVEAGRRSGTMNTASAALQMGRPVMAVPGPVTSAMSAGCHALIADRSAELVTDAASVIAHLPPARTVVTDD